MAPNSLFAILLRSPWWISFVVAGAIALVAAALLPAQYALFGAIGGLPILAVGFVAAWRQLRAPSAAQVSETLDAALAMPWRDFAHALTAAWQAGGATVERLDGPSADFRLTQGGRVTLVCARRWKAATHGVEPLRQLLAAVQAQGAASGAYLAVQGELSDTARLFARDHGLLVLQGPALAQLLRAARS
ncbi:restriction endonuclease [Acidovorax sp. SRB_14]|uniref:restriction endonuclease n=1 Tax=Acidovorax sp. SRB_14 TaxID=1962699 RepID=UPI0015646A85|nr:restriction endonuclease [Acidovorax sp. SRB_14]NMM80687.1 restriction endonuclease [Acidovorax sp. SRB_14]